GLWDDGLFRLFDETKGDLLDGHDGQLFTAADARRDLALRALTITDHQHIGYFFELRLADLVAELFVAGVDLDAQASRAKLGRHAGAVRLLPLGERQHARLHRCQPERKRAGRVFQQDGEEPLDRAEERSMNHHRPLLLPFRGYEGQVEAL